MRKLLAALVLAAGTFALIQAAEPTAKPAPSGGWIDLMRVDVWKKVDPGWIFASDVGLDPEKNTRLKAVRAENGSIWVNGDKGRLPNLVTKQSFGDCEVHVEFMIAKGSNAGVKFHGTYEIQILDSYGKSKLSGDSCGGIYPRAEAKPKYHHIDEGIAPRVNASKPAGEWQTLDAVWRSPRFNDKGEKTENARVVRAVLNGQLIHENQELKTQTGDNWSKKENPTGPLLLQADHGPFAFRNVKIKPLAEAK